MITDAQASKLLKELADVMPVDEGHDEELVEALNAGAAALAAFVRIALEVKT